ncbi:MAG TPA: MOSC domain-containing protein [Bacillota bacterium]|jgi:MOSC domain-containing protein YiiM|nr:MOSC domain-containing protein [Peptococcaceae bacterium MAG4]NLW38537.1 MOSC domain-containing protein [Peptococcaceae bacterium]HPU35354.1 MOSC domain-containing protein [Bacillota bacterium]HPZ43045.1 MOSC domain-containing protein [Bacillota bacterium]HQD75574.1 MOSC domain-containing protein [Bacillota bacterium]
MGKILAINIGNVRGIDKTPVEKANIVEGWGLEGDAHGGNWDRQVSIFPLEALEKYPEHKRDEFLEGGPTENIIVSGIPLEALAVGKTLKLGEAEVQIMYIGKDKYKEEGRPYIVSREGRFCRVVKGGQVKVGDEVKVI